MRGEGEVEGHKVSLQFLRCGWLEPKEVQNDLSLLLQKGLCFLQLLGVCNKKFCLQHIAKDAVVVLFIGLWRMIECGY